MPKKITKKKNPVKKTLKTKKVVVKKTIKKPVKKIAVKSISKPVSKPVLTLDEIFAQIDFVQDKEVEVAPEKTRSLDELFDEIFSNVETQKSKITLEDLFAPITQDDNNDLEQLIDDLLASPVNMDQPVGPTTQILHSANETPEFQAYEEAVKVYTSGKNFMRSILTTVSVAVAAIVIGIMWLQVTYGYFTEVENSTSEFEEVIDKSAQDLKAIKGQAQETIKSSIDKYQELKSLNK